MSHAEQIRQFLLDKKIISPGDRIQISLEIGDVNRRKAMLSRRFVLSRDGHPELIIRFIPSQWIVPSQDIGKTYSLFKSVHSFSVPSLVATFASPDGVFYAEEYLESAESLYDLVERGDVDGESALKIVREVLSEVWSLSEKPSTEFIIEEKKNYRRYLTAFVGSGLFGDTILDYIERVIDNHLSTLKQAWTSGDIIDRNLLRSGDRWYLIDFEYSHKTLFFFKEAYRSILYSQWARGCSLRDIMPGMGEFPEDIARLLSLSWEGHLQYEIVDKRSSLVYRESMRQLFWAIFDQTLIPKMDAKATELKRDAAEKDDRLLHLEEKARLQRESMEALEAKNIELQSMMESQRQALQQKDAEAAGLRDAIKNLEDSLRIQEEQILKLGFESQTRTERIVQQERQIAELNALNDREKEAQRIIRSSLGWRLLAGYWAAKDIIFSVFKKKTIDIPQDEMNFVCGVDSRIPSTLEVGQGSVLRIEGWCYHPTTSVRELNILVGDVPHRVLNTGISRPDVFQDQYRRGADSRGHSLLSGFWAFVPFEKISTERSVQLTLQAVVKGGQIFDVPLAKVTLQPSRWLTLDRSPRFGNSVNGPAVAICMATYNPPMEAFRRQIDSIKSQSHKNWICVINDDCSPPDVLRRMKEIIGQDARFYVFQNSTNLGFYKNFEECLRYVPSEASLVAFSDQDDYWYPNKLEACVAKFDSDTTLVYSDMHIVDADGGLLFDTYWTARKNNYTRLDVLLLANTVTGAASVFKRDLLEIILPFPEKIGDSFHDHFVACVALASGNIGYIDGATYDYRQHGASVLGHCGGVAKPSIVRDFIDIISSKGTLDNLKAWVSFGREIYSNDFKRLILIASVVRMRLPMAKGKKSSILNLFAGLEHSGFGLVSQYLRTQVFRRSTEYAERRLIRGWICHRLINYFFRVNRMAYLRKLRRGEAIIASTAPNENLSASADGIRRKIAKLGLQVNPSAKRRVNVLIPTIDFQYFFGGYIAKFNFVRRLAKRGYAVRVVIVDWCNYDPDKWKEEVGRYGELSDIFDLCEVAYVYERTTALEVSPADTFVATTWWTAHIAKEAVQQLNSRRFIYLIQEYEPFTFPMGSFSALAQQTYTFPHYGVFSTELLRDYFRQNKIGVFSGDGRVGDQSSVSFSHPLPRFSVDEKEMASRGVKRLLFYARPEAHAARNMFEIGFISLVNMIKEGLFDSMAWEFYAVGSVGIQRNLELRHDMKLKFLPKFNLNDYYAFLPSCDLGLSLMNTPHPSLPPIEMAAAGMLVVTNTCANKTEQRLAEISDNLIGCPPTIEGVEEGLRRGVGNICNYPRRLSGSHLNWSRSWDDTFNDTVMKRVELFIQDLGQPD